MQAVENKQQWIASLGSSEIRYHAAHLTSECAIHSATPAGVHPLLQIINRL